MSASPIATTRTAAGHADRPPRVWWVIASEIVIFGGLLGSYVMFRLSHDALAAQAAHTNTWIGAFNTLVLLTSSLFAVLGHKAADAGDGPRPRGCSTSRGGGLLFAAIKFRYEWPDRDPRTASRSRRTPSGRSTTRPPGIHAAHVIAGVISC